MKKYVLLCSLLSAFAFADPASDKTAHYFDSIKNDPQKLQIFLHDFPKGGDLHYHLTGSSYPENQLLFAKGKSVCIDAKTLATTVAMPCVSTHTAENALSDNTFYNSVINGWSMRGITDAPITERTQHFFGIFGKTLSMNSSIEPEIIAEELSRAGDQNELYLENMVEFDTGDVLQLVSHLSWENDFAKMREALLNAGLLSTVKKISDHLAQDEKLARQIMNCDTEHHSKGCDVTARYQFYSLRQFPPANTFALLLAGFELAKQNPHVVGINLVQEEAAPSSLKYYDIQMQMLHYLHQVYPQAHISLHAGELAFGYVPPQDLQDHIQKAIHIGEAERIGHGTDIAYENNSEKTLKEMADKHVAVEINLTSNELLLGVSGKNHPLPLYVSHHVPVVLSTDDEGILRTDLTHEYVKAALTYGFSYDTLKTFSRNSLTYGFMQGKSLWENPNTLRVNTACASDHLGSEQPSQSCATFLSQNLKARLQWKLEHKFSAFENSPI